MACSTHTIGDLIVELATLLNDKSLQPRTILCVNAHIYNLAVKNEALRRNLNSSRVIAADGMGVVWAARMFGVRMTERCNMTESFREFLLSKSIPSNTAILIGCSPDEANAAAAEIHRLSKHCRVIEAISGYLSDSEYQRICAASRADFILLGMGTPRTEQVAAIAAAAAPEAIVWGIGGGTVRILAGRMREAPLAWRRLGLQWLYRLITDPVTLWQRYLIGNPLFLMRVFRASRRSRGHPN